MKMINRGVVFLTIVLLIAIFPTLTGFVDFTEGDAFPDYSYLQTCDFIVFWTRMPDYQMISGLMMGMSTYILFVVYQGSRLSHRRINGHGIDSVNLFWGVLSVTALVRAVFDFFIQQSALRLKNKYFNNPPTQLMIDSTRRY